MLEAGADEKQLTLLLSSEIYVPSTAAISGRSCMSIDLLNSFRTQCISNMMFTSQIMTNTVGC